MTIQVDLTPEQENCVVRKAEHEGVSVGELLAQTAAFIYSDDLRDRDVLRERIAQADRGEFLSDEEAERRLAKLLAR